MPIFQNTPWHRIIWLGLVLALLLAPARAATAENAGPKAVDGAADPKLPGKARPAVAPTYEPALLDIAVGDNVLVNSRDLCPDGRGLQQNETSIVVSGDVVIAAFNDARGPCRQDHAAVGWGYSLDGGATWTDGGGLPSPRQLNNGDPWLGVSPDGRTFYLSGLYNGYSGLGFLRGHVEGKAVVWQEPVVIAFPPTGAFMDKEAFVVDPNSGAIYLTYTDFLSPTGIKMTRSYDGGDTWADPVAISTGGQGSFPAVDNQGNIYVAYNGGSQIRVARSTDGGDTFDPVAGFTVTARGVPSMDRSPSFPQVAVDMSGGPRDGWVYVVWQTPSPEGVLRPYISHSEDGGATWTLPIPMNTDDANAFHWWPSVSVDDNGNVNAIWLDRRLNPGTALTDVFFGQSTDGGYTFTDLRVTDVSGDWSRIGYDRGFTYAGDYIRAVSYGTDVYATWVDPRNGDPDIYFSRISGGAIALRRQN